MEALDVWVTNLGLEFSPAEVCGHSDLDPSKPNCPGFSVKEWWEEVK
jgi:hypothetical protein